MNTTIKRWARYGLCFSFLGLAACDSDDGPTIFTGTFVDAPVSNINFRTATQTGKTDANGNFRFRAGEQVVFSFGSISLPPVNARVVVTPVDIARQTDSGADVNSPVAVNIARLLQSVDADGDPENGIDIPDDLNPVAPINFEADAATFEAAYNSQFPTRPLVSASDATAHLQRQIDLLAGGDNGGNGGGGSSAQVCPFGGSPTSVSTLPSALASQVFDLTATTANTGAPFDLNQVVNFTFSSSGRLFVDNTEVSDAPYQCDASTIEFLWFDEPNDVIYAVAVLDGSLHEVTILNAAGTFFASLEPQGDTGGGSGGGTTDPEQALISSFAGSFSVNATAGAHETGSVVISADGSTIEFDTGITFDITAANVVVSDRIATFPNEPQIFVSVQVNGEDRDRLVIFLDPADTSTIIGFNFITNLFQANQETVSVSIASGGGSNGTNGTTSPGTVNASLVDTYTLVYSEASAGGPFTDGQEVSVTIAANGDISIDSLNLSNPFHRDLGAGPHLPEISWLDSATNIEYALSDNERGSFNEINVGDAARPTSALGLPTFLGQLRPKVVPVTAADVVGKHAGSYSFEIMEDSRTRAVGGTLALTISADGSISYVVNGVQTDISADLATYSFNDTRPFSTIEPHIEVSFRVPDQSDGTLNTVKLFFEGEELIAFGIGFNFTAEQRPLPTAESEMIAALITASPVELRVTKESSTFGGSFIPNGGLCQAVTVEFSDPADSATFATELQVGLFFYQRADWRYNVDAATGIQSLGRNSLQVNLHPNGEISLGEGFVDLGTLVMSNPRDFATSVQSEIDTECADFHLVNVDVVNGTASGFISGEVKVFDTDTSELLLSLPAATLLSVAPATTESLKVFVPIGTNYRVDFDAVSIPNGVSCTASNNAGQISTTNPTATITCN